MHKSYLEGTAGGFESICDGIGMSILAAIASTNDWVCSTLFAIVLIKSPDVLGSSSICFPTLNVSCYLLLGEIRKYRRLTIFFANKTQFISIVL